MIKTHTMYYYTRSSLVVPLVVCYMHAEWKTYTHTMYGMLFIYFVQYKQEPSCNNLSCRIFVNKLYVFGYLLLLM